MSSTDGFERMFAAGGELGRLVRQKDWSRTPLGAIDAWPQSLRSVLSICLGSRFPIAIYWGAELTLIYNDAWSPIPGTKHPWALGRPAREVWPEIWDTIGPLFAQVMERGEATYSEDALLPMHRHGYTEECYFNFTFTPIRGEDDRVEGVFNAVIETTFRVLGERRTRILRDLGEAVGPARSAVRACELATRSLERDTLDVPFCALYLIEPGGTTARRVSANALDDSVAPATLALGDPRWPLAQVHTTGRVEVLTDLATRFPQPLPGGPWPEPATAAYVAPIVAGGEVQGFMIVGASPRREVDTEYTQFVERAAALVSTSVANAMAYESERKRAEALAEIDRAKTTFFSNVSHEFRTPLTLMLGPQENALAAPDGALTGEDLRAVHRNTLRLLKLVNSLLDFARIEAGRAQASFQPTDLATLTRELAGAFQSAIEAGGLQLVVDCPALPDPVFVDRDMWEKIVLNLISNAFKFTFAGEIRVELRARAGHAELVVSDTGVGIAEAELPRVFERFHRIEGVRARTHEGSGIGLALVHELVRLHGGAIDVRSRLGHGTAFTIRVPFGSAHLPPDRIVAPATAASTALRADVFVEEAQRWLPAAQATGEPGTTPVAVTPLARVLVADDNADMREYVSRILSPYWQVETVADGERALARIHDAPPDLVVTDVMMPNLDGFGLLRALRADPATARIPLIMLSARAGEESRVEGLQAGADDYLPKPFGARELVARVATQLQAAAMRTAVEHERARLAAMFEQTPVSIAMFEGPDHRIALLNQQARAMMPATELRPQLDEVYASGRAMLVAEQRVARTDPAGHVDERFLTISFQPARDDEGRVVGVLAAGYEVTAEVRLRRSLEDASRAKDEFLAMLGHELRNPLAPITTALHLMRMRGQTSRELDVIERQVDHLARLVDDLLDISRITRGKIELRKTRVELGQAVARGLEIASPLLERRSQRVICDVPSQGLAIDGDPDRLAQIVSNLLTNAAKYSDKGTTVEVHGERRDDRAVLRVRDHGIGIAPEMLDSIFDVFVQQPQSLERSKGGLGLGLAIVRSLVRLHGGEVHAFSEGPATGSEFVVELPVADAVRQASGDAVRRAQQPPPPSRNARNRVLVVDDNVDSAQMVSDWLELRGFDVRVAYDGPSAIDVARAFQPHACLLDIGLPVMDGYEVAMHLRSLAEPSGGTKIVAVTGYGQDADRQRSSDAGFSAHLVKPIDLEKLVGVLGE